MTAITLVWYHGNVTALLFPLISDSLPFHMDNTLFLFRTVFHKNPHQTHLFCYIARHGTILCCTTISPNLTLPSFSLLVPSIRHRDTRYAGMVQLLLLVSYIEASQKDRPAAEKPIAWCFNGTAIRLNNSDELQRDLMAQFFPTTKAFTSFTRKLYRWGFRRQKTFGRAGLDGDDTVFAHDSFRRDERYRFREMTSESRSHEEKPRSTDNAACDYPGTSHSNSNMASSLALLRQRLASASEAELEAQARATKRTRLGLDMLNTGELVGHQDRQRVAHEQMKAMLVMKHAEASLLRDDKIRSMMASNLVNRVLPGASSSTRANNNNMASPQQFQGPQPQQQRAVGLEALRALANTTPGSTAMSSLLDMASAPGIPDRERDILLRSLLLCSSATTETERKQQQQQLETLIQQQLVKVELAKALRLSSTGTSSSSSSSSSTPMRLPGQGGAVPSIAGLNGLVARMAGLPDRSPSHTPTQSSVASGVKRSSSSLLQPPLHPPGTTTGRTSSFVCNTRAPDTTTSAAGAVGASAAASAATANAAGDDTQLWIATAAAAAARRHQRPATQPLLGSTTSRTNQHMANGLLGNLISNALRNPTPNNGSAGFGLLGGTGSSRASAPSQSDPPTTELLRLLTEANRASANNRIGTAARLGAGGTTHPNVENQRPAPSSRSSTTNTLPSVASPSNTSAEVRLLRELLLQKAMNDQGYW